MAMDLERVAAIGREVATDLDERLSVVSVNATDGGSSRVELLVTVSGCHVEPCMHLINVSRFDSKAMEREIRAKLQNAISAHRSA